ncbi:hypothetical protein HYV86_03960 [Candidatus Woesearchaeota archaeon]|nr:hypothetical protein [Candidatus Woesearchaeota archaeon]
MDVERIQKINALALELMKKGLASDRENAVMQAEEVFKSQHAGDYREMRSTLSAVQEVAQPRRDASSQIDLSQDRVKDILEQNSKFLVQKIREFQEKMDAMEREVEGLKIKLNYQRLPTAATVVSNQPAGSVPIQAPASMHVPPMPSSGSQGGAAAPGSHPRSGNFKDTDVSIEKFFYMGHK